MHSEIKSILIEVPVYLVDKYTKDFEDLVGSKNRESVYMLRGQIDDIMDILYDNPELLENSEFKNDYVKAIAMKESLIKLGIYYDA